MPSLLLRNLFFTIVHPGLVAGLFPYWILDGKINKPFLAQLQRIHYLGIAVFIIGLVIMLSCILRFAFEGRGTLSPADPTKRLVTHGLYKFSRNPMYVGVTLILIGESIFYQSASMWYYTLSIFIAFNLFILLVEEPRLKRDFGDEYMQYRKRVRRWV